MKLSRLILGALIVIGLSGVAYVAQQAEPSGSKMAGAAEKFIAGLSAEQKTKAVFDFDDKERLNWHFVPLQDRDRKLTRKGLPLEGMTAEQKQAALELVKSGTSDRGNEPRSRL